MESKLIYLSNGQNFVLGYDDIGDSVERETPFFAWRTVLHQLLHLELFDPDLLEEDLNITPKDKGEDAKNTHSEESTSTETIDEGK